MYWQRIQKLRQSFANDPRRGALRAILEDDGLREDAKEARAEPVRAALGARFDELRSQAQEEVESARAAWLRHMPTAIQRRAAASKPDRMAWGRSIGETALGVELVRNAKIAAESGDAAGAYGMRLAILGREDLEDGSVREALAALDQAGTTGWESTLAELVAAQDAMAQLEAEAPAKGDKDALFVNPAAVLSAAHAASAVPLDEDGSVRHLGSTDVDTLLRHAGVRESDSEPEPISLARLRRSRDPLPAA